MFTLPPRPPKDYVLKGVSNTQASSPQFTPSALPRATQTTLAKYCYPVPADDNEPADKSQIEELNDRVLNNWTKVQKAWWVDPPGKNAYFLNDVCKKYQVVVDADYDPRYKHRPKLFQRSYQYELECMEEARLQKLYDKTKHEEDEENKQQQKYKMKEKAKEKPAIELVPCKFPPPFWWKESVTGEADGVTVSAPEVGIIPPETTYRSSYLRWQKKPSIFGKSLTDPCKRREAVAKFGQAFRHEACTWYFENYPPPKIKFTSVKFSQ